ncbi:carboxypeptidase-like regulatory domain-containing protein [Flammeovirga sp. EKP202]|uniref:carboxypeptidase-like regulatory domain-containing protein n=1 Tax=Flammeovirga sp. EKP202 TaxID=2770592 RepID=UPI00165F4AE5|nr:carboxypeptidase-like regulatory domain-containing protein [Flammeovirga sp. EKP202]MBD0400536.1 carboxypeptidase regulatory-like domain-containing protein [Flammeovirga sp. EKP202]
MRYIKAFLFFLVIAFSLQCEVPNPYGDLYVLIRDESGNLVENCSVTLYGSYEGFINETDTIQGPNVTDENGRAFFLNLSEGTYYIAAKYINESGNVEKNNLLVATQTDVQASEIGFRNSITVIIWDSFIGNMSSAEGKRWAYSQFIDVTTGETRPVPDCLQDDELIFFRNGQFEYVSQELNCDEGVDDNFTGTFAPVSNGSFILIKDSLNQTRYGLYIVSATQTQMIAQYGPDFIVYDNVSN